jgi:hypothetical protein
VLRHPGDSRLERSSRKDGLGSARRIQRAAGTPPGCRPFPFAYRPGRSRGACRADKIMSGRLLFHAIGSGPPIRPMLARLSRENRRDHPPSYSGRRRSGAETGPGDASRASNKAAFGGRYPGACMHAPAGLLSIGTGGDPDHEFGLLWGSWCVPDRPADVCIDLATGEQGRETAGSEHANQLDACIVRAGCRRGQAADRPRGTAYKPRGESARRPRGLTGPGPSANANGPGRGGFPHLGPGSERSRG